MKVREKCHLFMVLIVEKYMKRRVAATKTHGSKGMYRKRGDHDARRGWSIYEYNTDIWNAIVCWTIPRATCIRQCNSHCNSNRQCRYVQIGRNILLPNAIMQAQIQMCNGKHASYNGSNKKPESGVWDQHISIAFGTFDISIVQHGIANTKTSWKGGAGCTHTGHSYNMSMHAYDMFSRRAKPFS